MRKRNSHSSHIERKKQKIRCLALLICASLLVSLTACGGGKSAQEEPQETEETVREGDVVEKETLNADALREDKSIYSDKSEWYEVETMYLTVRPGNAEDSTNHTWAEVNAHDVYYYRDLGIARYACEAILQVGDENGPVEGEFGYGETVPNATVCVRGQTSSKADQKNYKVRIKDGKGTYKDMQTIPLNKVQSDDLRFRNKMTFDLMQTVPQMTAIRTQFVHLYVKDETEGGSGEFQDYGLFSRLEQMNRAYLRNHGLDDKGHLYKVNEIFEWYAYDPLMKLKDDPDYDEEAFEHHLKIKGDSDHSKLQEVLKAVNNYAMPIEDIVDKYFDLENICYYLAFHILDGNDDIGGRNLYIYSPLNSEKWYLLSWDCDGCFERTENEMMSRSRGMSWEQGITKNVGVILYNRIFRVKEYRDALTAAVIDIKEHYLTEEAVRERAETCRDIVLPYVHAMPDSENWNLTDEEYNYIVENLPKEVEVYYQEYLTSLEKPWPFYVSLPTYKPNGELTLSWDASYDMDGESVTYTCILSRDPTFTDVIVQDNDVRVPEMKCNVELEPGLYFIRVQATNESGYTQDCFDVYTHDSTARGKRYGCKAVVLTEDGTFRNFDEDLDVDEEE